MKWRFIDPSLMRGRYNQKNLGVFVKKGFEYLYGMVMSRKTDYLILGLIVIIGFGLRVYRVGEDSFWYDEVGQAIAATQPTLLDVFYSVREHAGAMPMDYLVSRLMASISLREGIMRLPSVIWGTFSILVYYVLINQFEIPYKRQIALLVACMLSISPVNIQYSQEMRFYASLMFFYGMSTLFLVRAINASSAKNWFLYLITGVVGIYFHPFILFTAITGFMLVIRKLFPLQSFSDFLRNNKSILLGYSISVLLLFALFLPGYLFFHSQDIYDYGLGLNSDSILYGLGLKATITTDTLPPFGIWHIAQVAGIMLGWVVLFRSFKEYSALFFIWVSIAIQIIVTIVLDLSNNYPFLPRQIIHFTPFVLFVFSIGFMELISRLRQTTIKHITIIASVTILAFSSYQYVNAIYDHSKGGAREIAQIIVENYEEGQKVLILLVQHEVTLRYYLSQLVGEEKSIAMTLTAQRAEELEILIQENPDIHYIFLSHDTNGDIRQTIRGFGFKQEHTTKGSDFLYILP